MSRFEYPRPQLVRPEWTSLNGEWEFAFDDASRHSGPRDEIDWRHRIEVPFAPELMP